MGVLNIGVPIIGVLSNKKQFSIRNFSLKIVYFVIQKLNITSLVDTSYKLAHYISSRTKPPFTNKINVRITNKETLIFCLNV